MRCKKVRRLIDDHVDGLLPAGKAERVRAHLDHCEDCHAEAEAARAASTSLAVWGDLDPPAGCFDAILARIEHLPEEARDRGPPTPDGPFVLQFLRGRGGQWIATGGLAAAAAIMIGAGLGTARPVPTRRHAIPAQSIGFDVARTGLTAVTRPAISFLVGADARIERRPTIENDGVRTRKLLVPDADSRPDPVDLLPEEGPR